MLNYFNVIGHVGVELESYLRGKIRIEEFEKAALLLSPGQKCDKIWYISSGACCIYVLDQQGEKVILDVVIGPGILWMPEYLNKGTASRHYIEALADCRLQSLNYGELTKQSHRFKELRALENELVKIQCIEGEKRFLMMREREIDKRYAKCIDIKPGIEKSLTAYLIAVFLNTTPETLSRVKKKNRSAHDDM